MSAIDRDGNPFSFEGEEDGAYAINEPVIDQLSITHLE